MGRRTHLEKWCMTHDLSFGTFLGNDLAPDEVPAAGGQQRTLINGTTHQVFNIYVHFFNFHYPF
jgi:hypothetical protein